MTCPPFMVPHNSDCRVGYSDFKKLKNFTKHLFKKKKPILANLHPKIKRITLVCVYYDPSVNFFLIFAYGKKETQNVTISNSLKKSYFPKSFTKNDNRRGKTSTFLQGSMVNIWQL